MSPKFNKQKEITKSPKIYFQDPGLRNFAKKYKPPCLYVATRDFWGKTHYNNVPVYFFPAYAIARI
ncbi:MAG: hypothetical protein B5M53_05000 [Candidatus Cloacimonas sp. 4484_209]|nr:hypothetical protein [Candidatus Calescamantes bacterium]OQX54962.1 MAG: hypothetical protein B5M53_05000 [Candidatus Cloacimonas sp. 4484_209]